MSEEIEDYLGHISEISRIIARSFTDLEIYMFNHNDLNDNFRADVEMVTRELAQNMSSGTKRLLRGWKRGVPKKPKNSNYNRLLIKPVVEK